MVKKNLFSKVLAGVLAAGMVVTMLPAFSLTSLAGSAARVVTIAKPTTDYGYRYRIMEITETQYNEGVADVWNMPAASFPGSSRDAGNQAFNVAAGQDYLYLLARPEVYYEFSESYGWAPAGTQPAGIVWDSTGDGSANAAFPYSEIVPKRNERDLRDAGQSWMVRIPTKGLEDDVTINMSAVAPVQLKIVLEVEDGIDVAQTTGPAEMKGELIKKERTYTLWWDESLGAAAGKNLIRVRTDVGNSTYISAADDELVATAVNELISPANDAQRRMTFRASRLGGSGQMTVKINGATYGTHALTSQAIAFMAGGATAYDVNPYIEFGKNATTDLYPMADAAKTATAGFKYTNAPVDGKDPIKDGRAVFSVWWEELFALYFRGLAKQDVPMGANFAAATATPGDLKASAYASTDANGEGLIPERDFTYSQRYFKNKTLTISLGSKLNKGDVIFHNGEIQSKDLSVANFYRWTHVFRDKNGLRFETTENDLQDSWASDVRDVTVSGFQENDTLEFTLKIDPLYQRTKDTKVWLEGTGILAVDITDKEGEDGVFKVELGGAFPYHVRVTGLDRKATRKVINIPEDDAKYDRHNTSSSDAGPESYYQDFRLWNFYSKNAQVYTNWMGMFSDSCNVAEPRYEVYLKAHEEDNDYLDVFPFGAPRAVATPDDDFLGHDFPIGEHKINIRFSDTFIGGGHGTFNDDMTDDRYGKGPDFKVTLDGQELKADADGLYTMNVTEGDEPMKLKVEGVKRAYYVTTPNVAGYNIEANVDLFRDKANHFRASVIEGENYKFRLNLADGMQPGAGFKVMLMNDDDDHKDHDDGTVVTPDAEGWYSFPVYNDTSITVYGLEGNGFVDTLGLDNESILAIEWLVDQGATDGIDAEHFGPNNNTTRAEFVGMLWKYYGRASQTGNGGYSDVGSDAWYRDAVAWGTQKGIVTGYPDGTFRPAQIITRAEVAAVVSRLCGLGGNELNHPFTDVASNQWYAVYVSRAFLNGIVNGTSQTTFTPSAAITREHYALMLYRSRNMLPAK